MEETSVINFDINLRKFSTYRVATALWESPAVKKEVKSYGSDVFDAEGKNISSIYDKKSKWGKLSNKILNYIAALGLRQELTSELENAIILIGRQLFYWLAHVIFKKVLDVKFLPYYFFTCHGTIDEYKIYQVLREDQSFLEFLSTKIYRGIYYVMACFNGDFKFIRQKLKEIAIALYAEVGIKIKDYSKLKVNGVMTIVLIYYFAAGDRSIFKVMYANVKSSKYANGADEMFLSCVRYGRKIAAEYFYQKLEKNDLQGILDKAALGCLSFGNEFMSEYQVIRNAELFLYVLWKMSDKQRKQLLVDKIHAVYNFFVSFWPCQNLCLNLVDYVWDNLMLSDQLFILQATLISLENFTKIQKKTYNSMLLPVLEKILLKLPEEPKISLFRQRCFVYYFFEISNFSCINKIIKDPDLAKFRSELLTGVNQQLWINYLVVNGGHSKNIKDYMRIFKFSDEEKKKLIKFSDNSVLLYTLLADERFDVADDILEWQCCLSNETVREKKKKMKNSINAATLCFNLIENGRFEKLEKYLKWQLDNDEKEIRTAKALLYSDEFIWRRFWKHWINNNNNLQLCKDKCSNILKCYLKTDNDFLLFKEKLLESQELFLQPLFDYKTYSSNTVHVGVSQLNEVLELFSFSTIKVNQIKQKIKKSIDWWLDKYPDKVLASDALIDWITDTEEEKRIIIRNYLDSVKGAKLCFDFCRMHFETGLHNSFLVEAKDYFFYNWVKRYGDINKLKFEMQKISRVTAHQSDINAITGLLDKLNMR